MQEEPELITYFHTYRSAWTVLYMETFFFPLINTFVCTTQMNQTLDALIKLNMLHNIIFYIVAN